MFFEITHTDKHSGARAGVMHTNHGDIHTPVFMPVGTQATVKTLDSQDLLELNAEIILGNTYHLHLRPGEDTIAELGGLHKFMNWDRPMLTDSGGFQVFSLQHGSAHLEAGHEHERLVRVDDDGVTFRSYVDGSEHRFTPEIAMDIQQKLGADIVMAFDECTQDSAPEKIARAAMERTHKWAKRCIAQKSGQFLFGIIQGAGHEALRKESAQFISSLPFDGIAIGGESVGYNMEATKKILSWVMPFIPKNKPHYTMGVGNSPRDLFEVVERGADMFDCVAPTRNARNGRLYAQMQTSPHLFINIVNSQFKKDESPIDAACLCAVCAHYSRAYLHHLFQAKEMTGFRLATLHNLHFFLSLMRDMRSAIQADAFAELKRKWMPE